MHLSVRRTPSLLLLLNCVALVCSDSTNETTVKASHDVCTSPECYRRAEILTASLDRSVRPCDDFYSYACGGWIKSRRLPDDLAYLDPMKILDVQVLHTVKDILARVEVAPGQRQNVSDKAAVAYQACMAAPKQPDTLMPVIEYLKIHGLGEWPITDGSAVNKTWKEILLKAGMSSVLTLFVGKDVKTLSSHIIQIDQVQFSVVGRNQLIHPNDNEYNVHVIDAYKGLILTIAMFIRPEMSTSKIRELADTLVDFEGQLANLTTPPEQSPDISTVYKRVNISVLESDFPMFPLLQLLQKEFNLVNITIKAGEVIEFYCSDYYEKLIKFLEEADSTTFFNYVGMKLLLGVAAFASKGVHEAQFAIEKMQYGVETYVPRWRECMDFVNSELAVIAGYFYVQHKFTPHAKKEVEDLIERLKRVFQKNLRDSKWMDEKTKSHAVDKLLKMEAKIGYPDWLLNTSYLEELGNFIPQLDHNGPYIDIRLAIRNNNLIHSLKLLRKPYNKSAEIEKIGEQYSRMNGDDVRCKPCVSSFTSQNPWAALPTVVNAFHNWHANEMVYPSAILQIPIYEYGLPRSLNFGAIGSIVGHEMTHGFDAEGSQFDDNGELQNWWSNSSRQVFEEKAMCFVRQYSNISDPEAETQLDGYHTVNEDIADNGGLRTAFQAYRKFLKEECDGNDTRLPGLENLSGKQLFFIANAMTWCSLNTKKDLKWRIQYDQHSLNQYRVNVPMKNMEEFSNVFKCQPGDPMNPKHNDRCILW